LNDIQAERRSYLIRTLLDELEQYANIPIPSNEQEQKNLLQSLLNLREPLPVSGGFLKVQDAYLQKETERKGITEIADLKPIQDDLYLWQGDITTLRCDAIVNAANSGMTGCYHPCHGCIDNAIHTFAGVQLRLECAEIMEKQGFPEPTGQAKLTKAYNLPCSYVLHTVGPIVHDRLTDRDQELLASCYRSCLKLAEQNGVNSIAFCCISTGEFHFPNDRAAEIAIQTVKEYKSRANSSMEVIFNVFKQVDTEIYRDLLGAN